MSIEEIIAKLEEMAADREDILPGCLGWDEAKPLREAIALLKTHKEAQPNDPLTLEELRRMDGHSVWVEGLEGSWALVMVRRNGDVLLNCANGARYIIDDGYDPTDDIDHQVVTAYVRPPKEGA